MNVKSLRNEIKRTQKSSASQSQRADQIEEDEDMEDMSAENQDTAMNQQQPQKRESEEANQINKSQKQVTPQVTVVLDGFTDKTEKQQLSENITSLGLNLGSGLPSKLNSHSGGLTVILSTNGNYDPPQNLKSSVFVVNKQWLIDCEELKQVVTHPEKLSQYGFLFKSIQFHIYESGD